MYDKKSYLNWFDIENSYFQELVKIKERAIKNWEYQEKLDKLHSDFNEIKDYLSEYLRTINIKHTDEVNRFFNANHMFNGVDYNMFIINFNYTKTIEEYFEEQDKTSIFSKIIKIYYIHNTLKEGNIIFGYGNDQNRDYEEIKNLENNKFLENFKTFQYLKDDKYMKLYADILDNESIKDYVVFVLGHSMGTTDKTLLEEIFNSPKCKKIHLFKRSDLEEEEEVKKSFNELVFAASRIISNEKDLRKKILNYKESDYFPYD